MTSVNPAESVQDSFDHYVRLVCRAIGVPIGLVTRVEKDRQVFIAALGLAEPYRTTAQTPLSHSMCQYVVRDREPLVVSDAREDPVLADNLAIPDLSVIAYAGWPLSDHTGEVIGSLCAIDTEPHDWSPEELAILKDLASACSAELAQRGLATQLGLANDELARSNSHLDMFAGQVSHDLRTPLSSLSGYLELIDDVETYDTAASAQFDRLVPKARRSADRMAELLDDVLGFATVGGTLSLTDVDVEALMSSVLEDLGPELKSTILVTGGLPAVCADPVQLRTIIQNLLANALRYAPSSTISVDATDDGEAWTLMVVDHGPGIPEADRTRVLQPMVRLVEDGAGSGLGLTTCQRLAMAHGGALRVDETRGGGTTVVLTLPAGTCPEVA